MDKKLRDNKINFQSIHIYNDKIGEKNHNFLLLNRLNVNVLYTPAYDQLESVFLKYLHRRGGSYQCADVMPIKALSSACMGIYYAKNFGRGGGIADGKKMKNERGKG